MNFEPSSFRQHRRVDMDDIERLGRHAVLLGKFQRSLRDRLLRTHLGTLDRTDAIDAQNLPAWGFKDDAAVFGDDLVLPRRDKTHLGLPFTPKSPADSLTSLLGPAQATAQ